ncbi:hypothetical protein [Microbulbifer sp. PAAF003]|uniref:hypothetical protein n=1 Tax=Microbulbifer sp. PAAF003 TaxID=3243375 RepID=UPI0040391575
MLLSKIKAKIKSLFDLKHLKGAKCEAPKEEQTASKEAQTPESKPKKEVTLYEYKPFKYTLWLGGALLLIFQIAIWISLKDYEICPSSKCLNNYLIYHQPIIKVATALIAIATIIGLIFRTNQTAYQMEHEHRKTIFSHYFEHKKMFFDALKNLEKEHGIRFKEKNSLYSLWFTKNAIDNFDISLIDSIGPLYVANRFEILRYNTRKIYRNRILSEEDLMLTQKELTIFLIILRIEYDNLPTHELYESFDNFKRVTRVIIDISNTIISLSDSDKTASQFSRPISDIFCKANSFIKEKRARRKDSINPLRDYLYICTFGEKNENNTYKVLGIKDYGIKVHLCPFKVRDKELNIELRHLFEEEVKRNRPANSNKLEPSLT